MTGHRHTHGHNMTAVSAPGKVFLAGGYLVLDRQYTGLIFGLSARINVVAQDIPTMEGVQLSEIVVESPQFLDSQWRYGYRLLDNEGGIKVTQLQIGTHINSNPFVETTLGYALTYITRMAEYRPNRTISSARLTILADDDYYSAPHDTSATTQSTGAGASRFSRFPTTLRDAHKTGLGSSAAVVTSLTAALLTHYLDAATFTLDSDRGRAILHNLSQIAHCAAQGKIGSGFDVATAIYGSCRYRRFSPALLAGLGEPGEPGFAVKLQAFVEGSQDAALAWDTEVVKDGVRIPPGVALRICDVDCGSQTVSMVKQVLAWRGANADASKALWDELQRRNERLAAVLQEGRTADLRAAVRGIRELLKKMGTESGAEIEPDSQTELLDALEGVEGVYGGVVPGAGGFDAAAILMQDDAETAARVEKFLKDWHAQKGSRVTLLRVRGEMEGVRAEPLDTYKGWLGEK